jgi:catechol 2,3-dioxygenase
LVSSAAYFADHNRDAVAALAMGPNWLGNSQVFLSAGGYHHYLGAKTRESAGVLAPPPGVAALRRATIVLPDGDERNRLLDRVERSGQVPQQGPGGPVIRDPSCIALGLTTRS